MRVLIVGEHDTRELLAPGACIDAMERAFAAVARGEFVQPLRLVAWHPQKHGAIAAMPAYVEGSIGAKLITVFPENRAAGLESHQGLVALYDPRDGSLKAIVHAGAITAIRTAAVSALATKYLARTGARDLALLGSGVQADSHLAALLQVRPIRRVRVWSRTPGNAQAFAERAQSEHGIPVISVERVEDAVRDAEIVCTLTASREPIVAGSMLAAGTHVNAVGGGVPAFRELETSAVLAARVYVDSRSTALQESDDLRVPIAEGAFTPDAIAGELSEIVSGACPLHQNDGEITIFESVGMAIEDLAAAEHVYERAKERNAGTYVDF